MSVPNTLVIAGFSDTGTLFANSNPKDKLFHLVNNNPEVIPQEDVLGA